MSMNLYCEEVELYQTPTWITYLSLYDCNNVERYWKETLYIYKEWLESTLTKVWSDHEQQMVDDERERFNMHIEELMGFDELTFSYI